MIFDAQVERLTWIKAQERFRKAYSRRTDIKHEQANLVERSEFLEIYWLK